MVNKHKTRTAPVSRTRRIFIAAAGLLFLWPILRLIGFKLPKKPRIVEVAGNFQSDRFISKDEFIIFTEEDDIWAVSRTCTHLGCRLNFKEDEGILECPCHQSRFTPDGAVVHGPAKSPLKRYSVESLDDSSTYLITIS